MLLYSSTAVVSKYVSSYGQCYFKKYIIDFEKLDINENLTASIITPDKEIVTNGNNLSPAYLVFDNYELILKWNRSLRFALAVCTLNDKFKNEL